MTVMTVTRAMALPVSQGAIYACTLGDLVCALTKVQTGWTWELWLESGKEVWTVAVVPSFTIAPYSSEFLAWNVWFLVASCTCYWSLLTLTWLSATSRCVCLWYPWEKLCFGNGHLSFSTLSTCAVYRFIFKYDMIRYTGGGRKELRVRLARREQRAG